MKDEKIRELKNRFIEFYSQFDYRLRKINKSRIDVKINANGVYLSCKYYGKSYGQFYRN